MKLALSISKLVSVFFQTAHGRDYNNHLNIFLKFSC